jgi:hypothetical protein
MILHAHGLKNVTAKSLFKLLGLIVHQIQTGALKELNLNNHEHRP